MIAIHTKNLTKKYKTRIAVKNLNLTIFQGETLALLGFNGAGKTTLIKLLTGLIQPTEGDAFIFNKSITNELDSIKQHINISPQETAIAPNLTVEDNLIFISQVYGDNKMIATKKANDIIKTFDLNERKKDKAKKLSGGLKRRLSIAMALITNPKILFLDEPTLGLDIKSRRELWKIITNLKGKITIILTTHYLDEVEALADRIAIIDQGILKKIGTLDSLRKESNLTKLEDIFLELTEGEIK